MLSPNRKRRPMRATSESEEGSSARGWGTRGPSRICLMRASTSGVAAEAPLAGDDFADSGEVAGAMGLRFVGEGVVKCLEVGLVFAGEDDQVGAETGAATLFGFWARWSGGRCVDDMRVIPSFGEIKEETGVCACRRSRCSMRGFAENGEVIFSTIPAIWGGAG